MANLNLNKVIIGGRMTSDPELKRTPQGTSVTTFSIAVNRKGKDAQTDFINCVAWRQTSEFICNYFKKGNSIAICGELNQRVYTDKNNEKRSVYEVSVNETFFVDSKTEVQPPTPNFEEVPADSDLPF